MAKREMDLGPIIEPSWILPKLYFDPVMAELWQGAEGTGYEFKIENADLYYRVKK